MNPAAAAAPFAAPALAPPVAQPQQPYPVDPYGAGGLPSQYALNPSPSPAPVSQAAGPVVPQQQQPAYQPQPWEAPVPGSQPAPAAQPTSFAPGQQQGFPTQQQQQQQPYAPFQQYGSPAPVPQASSSGFVTPSTPAAAGAYSNGHHQQTGPSLPLSHAQQKFFLSLCRQLKKLPQAYAFSLPVDPIALGIPHYHQIITHPMDLSTIETKLQASGPKGKGKKGGVPGRYAVKEEVVEDFRRVWGNSDRFNGRDHAVSNAGRALEEVFERELPRLPADEEVRSVSSLIEALRLTDRTLSLFPPRQPKPPTPKPTPSYPAYPPGVGGPAGVGRDSEAARPKRDVHPPPPKDTFLSANDPSRRKSGGGLTSGIGGGSGKKGRFDEQFRFLRKEIDACFKGKGAELCWPFLQPVDPVAMGIPEYPTIVKRPMDLSTIKANLADGIYEDPIEVNQDVKLMLRNCNSFNPQGTAVWDAGRAVEAYWQGRWKAMPPPPAEPVESESEYEVDSADEGESLRGMSGLPRLRD
jgi:bromodomain-containing factor 1